MIQVNDCLISFYPSLSPLIYISLSHTHTHSSHTHTGGVRFASFDGSTSPGVEKKKMQGKKKGVRVLVPEEGGGGEKAKAAGVKSKDKKAIQAPSSVSKSCCVYDGHSSIHVSVHILQYM